MMDDNTFNLKNKAVEPFNTVVTIVITVSMLVKTFRTNCDNTVIHLNEMHGLGQNINVFSVLSQLCFNAVF